MTINPDDAQRAVGEANCLNCGAAVTVRISKKGHLYYNCAAAADGGCLSQYQCRSDVADAKLAARITRWRSPEDRKRFLSADTAAPDDDALDEDRAEEQLEADEPADAPEPNRAPPRPSRSPARATAKRAAAAPKKKSFWDMEL